MKNPRAFLATLSAAFLLAPAVFAAPPPPNPPTGGTFTVSPQIVHSGAPITVTLAGWTGQTTLHYQVFDNGALSADFGTASSGIIKVVGGSTHTITATITDESPIPGTANVGPVTVTVDDVEPHTTITSGPSGITTGPDVTFEFTANEPNVRFHGFLDGVDGGIIESPYHLTNLTGGQHTFRVAAIDAANNVDVNPPEATWYVQLPAELIPFAITGMPVPFSAGLPEGAVWTGFGTPAVSPHGTVAVVGKWHAPAQTTPVPLKAQSGVGIFIFREQATLLVKVGDPVPEIGNAIFGSFRDPVVDDEGHVAFIASIKNEFGPKLASNLDTVVVASLGDPGTLEVIAREGLEAPEAPGAVFKAFGSVSLKGPEESSPTSTGASTAGLPPVGSPGLAFTASLTGIGVTSANDMGAWWIPGNTPPELHKLVREGDSSLFDGTPVKSFSFLKPLGGSPGVDRGFINSRQAYVLVNTVGHQQVLFNFRPDQPPLPAASLHEVLDLGGDQTLKWAKMDMPSSDVTTAYGCMLGSLETGTDGVPSANAKGIFLNSGGGFGWEPLVRTGDATPIGASGSVFSAFKDPVNSLDSRDCAFVATVKGDGIDSAHNDVLWFSRGRDGVYPVAREGDATVPDAPGAQWKSFASIAMPGGFTGPLFTANLVKGQAGAEGPGGITGANDFGLYATNYETASVFGVLREGQQLGGFFGGKTVKGFTILKAAAGSAGNTRAFNSIHEIILRVTFTDQTSGIMGIVLPGGGPAPR